MPKLTPEQSERLIARYVPRNVTVKWRKDGNLAPAWTDEEDDGSGVMLSPYPDTHMRALTFLHECAHFANGTYRHELPEHEDEYIAERTAIQWWRAEGYVVPPYYLKLAKSYIRYLIKKDRKRKPPVKIKAHIARWAATEK